LRPRASATATAAARPCFVVFFRDRWFKQQPPLNVS
jgi:hypothetical protein